MKRNTYNKTGNEKNDCSIDGLLQLDGEEFIVAMYREILMREPDPVGRQHYSSMLESGAGKLTILTNVCNSEEAIAKNVQLDGMDEIRRKGYLIRLIKSFVNKKKPKMEQAPLDVIAPGMEQAPLNMIETTVAEPIVVGTAFCSIQKHIEATTANPSIWIDISHLMSNDNAVGIINIEAEVLLIAECYKQDSSIRFCCDLNSMFVELPSEQFDFLRSLHPYEQYKDFDSARRMHLMDIQYYEISTEEIRTSIFNPSDIVVCIGCNSTKHNLLIAQEKHINNFVLINILYNTHALDPVTSCYFTNDSVNEFISHYKWATNTCDKIVYTSKASQTVGKKYASNSKWSECDCVVIDFEHSSFDIGKTEISHLENRVDGEYILCLGPIDKINNIDTFYKAYKLALQSDKSLPIVIFLTNSKIGDANDLIDTFARDKSISSKFIVVKNNEVDVDWLIKNAISVFSPGLTSETSMIKRSVLAGTTCVLSDIKSNHFLGSENLKYVPAFDVKAWAEQIILAKHNLKTVVIPNVLQVNTIESTIKNLIGLFEKCKAPEFQHKAIREIWMDISTSYLYWDGGVAGIIRAELTFAKEIYALNSNVRFFAYSHGAMFEVVPERLGWLLDASDIVSNYKWFQDYWKGSSVPKDPFSFGPPSDSDERILRQFPDNSIVLFTCIDWNMQDSRLKEAVRMKMNGNNVQLSQLIYDFTPFLVPHLHMKATCDGYLPFIEYVSNHFDHLIYGGQTALRDGLRLQNENGWQTPASDYIEFGSDICSTDASDQDSLTLIKYGLKNKFILTVGTIEPRKNHEALYKAYLLMLSKGKSMPKLVIVGKKGWKFDDFIGVFENDTRVDEYISIISPTDSELDALYRNCMFTLLPSFYEGWSLTLPESLSYGKFCLTSKVDPLIETGRDLVDYINPLDVAEWGEKIHFYAENADILKEREEQIKRNWNPKTWKESSKWLLELMLKSAENSISGKHEAS